jgi:hypothetical protein
MEVAQHLTMRSAVRWAVHSYTHDGQLQASNGSLGTCAKFGLTQK